MRWIKTLDYLPQEGVKVLTKIDDEHGCRNEQVLFRLGSLWYTTGFNPTYVYYVPTHWRLWK